MGGALERWAGLLVVLAAGEASIRFSKTLSSSAVLQRSPRRATVWGWTGANETVSVDVDGSLAGSGVADATGAWEVRLPPRVPGPPVTITAKDSSSSASLEDVLFGDVWFCTGQSNMGVTIEELGSSLVDWNGTLNNGTAEAAVAAAYPLVRLAHQKTASSATPIEDPALGAGWRAPTREAVESFSAV